MTSVSDEIGKEVIKELFLKAKGIQLNETSGQHNRTDLSGYNEMNELISVEVKFRKGYSSTGLSDNACEESKIIANRGFINDGIYQKAYLFSVYNDGVVRGTNLTAEYTVDKRNCPTTSEFQNNTRKIKPLASFTQFKTYYLSSFGIDINEIKNNLIKGTKI